MMCQGLIDSAWFLLVAMATIGYGDKVWQAGGDPTLSIEAMPVRVTSVLHSFL